MQGQLMTSVAERRARLVVQCACELLGIDASVAAAQLRLPLSVVEFEIELRNRFGAAHPDLVFRTDSTLERARLDRRGLEDIPKVILRQGAPRRDDSLGDRAASHGVGHALAAKSQRARAEGAES
jgi:hypothetical protein